MQNPLWELHFSNPISLLKSRGIEKHRILGFAGIMGQELSHMSSVSPYGKTEESAIIVWPSPAVLGTSKGILKMQSSNDSPRQHNVEFCIS